MGSSDNGARRLIFLIMMYDANFLFLASFLSLGFNLQLCFFVKLGPYLTLLVTGMTDDENERKTRGCRQEKLRIKGKER